ncbi:MAG TPA: hypothetical protein VJ506_04740 [Candidatus Limnocylindrales bacterium]|nr:hypothetical protein [Candidatus Limnocylindrales bacterium]
MRRPRPSTGAPAVVLAALLAITVAACGPAGTSGPSTAPTSAALATAGPSPAPTVGPSASGPFAGAPYAITLPSGWQAFNLADPAAKGSLDAFAAANPSLAVSIQQFESMTNARMAVNPLLGDILLIVTTPSGGVSLDTLAQTFTAQFQAVPGLEGSPVPEDLTLPGGAAVHWDIRLSGSKAGGGTIRATESVYLFVSATDAVVVEFVTPAGGAIPDEQSIVSSFTFTK